MLYDQGYIDGQKAGERHERIRVKEIIMAMTAIPRGAQNPTRDWKVILGEQLCDLIGD